MIRLTKVKKSRYFWGSASVSCLISFLESLRRAGAGVEAAASAPVETFAPGDVGTAAVVASVGGGGASGVFSAVFSAAFSDPGLSTVSGLAPADGIAGKLSAQLSSRS